MKTSTSQLNQRPHRKTDAFTLIELMVGIGIFLGIFVGVIIGLQMFGLRVYTHAATKMSAAAEGRKTMNVLREQIRSAKVVYVGTYKNSKFSRITNGLPQTGNALAVYFASTNNLPSAKPVIYYQDPSRNSLLSVSNQVVSRLANYVTNYYVFTAEDYQSKVQTSYQNNPVIQVTLNFCQWQYPRGFVGTNALNAYDFYRLQARVSQRSKE